MKKAVTPLISSVLLIAFAVGLGLMVMSWGKTTTAIEMDSSLCEEASLNIIILSDKEDVCFADNKVYATVENNGEVMITGFRASIIGDTAISQPELDNVMNVADIARIEIPYDASLVGNIEQVRLVPRIDFKGVDRLCVKSVLEMDSIDIC